MTLDMLGSQTSQDANGAVSGVLHESSRDDLHGISHGLVWPLLNAFDRLRQLRKLDSNSHLRSTTSGRQARMEDNVPSHRHGVLKIPLNLVQDILGRSSQQDCACLGLLALPEESEVLVADLLDFKQSALGTNIRLLEILHTVHDRCAGGAGNSVVVRLSHAANSRDVVLDQEVLSEIWETGELTFELDHTMQQTYPKHPSP